MIAINKLSNDAIFVDKMFDKDATFDLKPTVNPSGFGSCFTLGSAAIVFYNCFDSLGRKFKFHHSSFSSIGKCIRKRIKQWEDCLCTCSSLGSI